MTCVGLAIFQQLPSPTPQLFCHVLQAPAGQPSDVPARLLEACNLVDAACATCSDTEGSASDKDP